MNQETYQNGLKHLLQIEPNFKKFNPAKKINFFLRPEGFEGMSAKSSQRTRRPTEAEVCSRASILLQNGN